MSPLYKLLENSINSNGIGIWLKLSADNTSALGLLKDAIKEGEKLDSDQCDYIASMVATLCHLLKKHEVYHIAFQSFMWKVFIPLMKMLHPFDREMLNQVAESFFDVVTKTNAWGVLEETLESFLKRIWNCCKTLFSLGPLERRDAYSVLSLYLSSFSYSEGSETADRSDRAEEFDVSAEKEFWVEMKRGLVDEDGLVRKQSLHILKTVLQINVERQCNNGVSESKSQEKHSSPRGMTKRELWAAKEARSLGVGKLCNSIDVKGQQQWEAFILLYEMLEEYGTHLVEAAWNHQVSKLLQFCESNDNLPSSISGIHPNQMETSGEIFEWLSILWERGFRHGNPQVRCMIMQSFLGIEWKDHGNCAKSVPESFVLGPFMEGLNDPVHHKDFGVKGVYSSRTIEGASRFLHQYASFLNGRKQIAFLSNLATVAKRSFGRVGLMALAECIASAASGVGTHNDSEAECSGDALAETVQMESCPENFTQTDKSDLLDVLRFVIESSKQHFNPNYRLRVCEKVLEAAASLVCASDVPLEKLLHFISAVPREFTDYGGM
ncbi:hypothetical protein LWI29_014296 [Acer saccharum]|uniref:Uncharacterized protein n=1 Tax=Acer saccharum TaxID=4024 RepID=A0AA39S1X7_ACESA|nr:hypothetical protein LWI29_014296 [Acer saccharum]